jgi:hypothetical protein
MRAFRVFAAATAIALAGCSGFPVSPANSGTEAHGSAAGWTVSATLEAYPDGTVKACYLMFDSYPSDCEGLPVTQLGKARIGLELDIEGPKIRLAAADPFDPEGQRGERMRRLGNQPL